MSDVDNDGADERKTTPLIAPEAMEQAMRQHAAAVVPRESNEDRIARERADWIAVSLVPFTHDTYTCRTCGALVPADVVGTTDAVMAHYRFHMELRTLHRG